MFPLQAIHPMPLIFALQLGRRLLGQCEMVRGVPIGYVGQATILRQDFHEEVAYRRKHIEPNCPLVLLLLNKALIDEGRQPIQHRPTSRPGNAFRCLDVPTADKYRQLTHQGFFDLRREGHSSRRLRRGASADAPEDSGNRM